jgi:hypothetical protein
MSSLSCAACYYSASTSGAARGDARGARTPPRWRECPKKRASSGTDARLQSAAASTWAADRGRRPKQSGRGLPLQVPSRLLRTASVNASAPGGAAPDIPGTEPSADEPPASPGCTPSTSSETAPPAAPRCTPGRRTGSLPATAGCPQRRTAGTSNVDHSAFPGSA